MHMFAHNLAPAEAFHPVFRLQERPDQEARAQYQNYVITGSPSPIPMMEAANKEAAEECLSKAQASFRKL